MPAISPTLAHYIGLVCRENERLMGKGHGHMTEAEIRFILGAIAAQWAKEFDDMAQRMRTEKPL